MKNRWSIIFISLLVSYIICFSGEGEDVINYLNCMECHVGIEKISPNHSQDCAKCHLYPEIREKGLLEEHGLIIKNPSSPENWDVFCMPCHREEISNLKKSLHYTMAGIINQTRYLWGAQERANPPIYGIGTLRALPEPGEDVYPDRPDVLVDDFLRKKCLRCHISTKGPSSYGLWRSTGCATCHVIYDNDGLYRGNDKAIDKRRPGRPKRHLFTRRIPIEQCLHCHNGNNVGADYVGMFEYDYSYMFGSPIIKGKPARPIYGMNYHHLSRDVHMERGLSCIDCHKKEDVMGDGRIYGYQLEVPKRRCIDCHGGYVSDVNELRIKEIIKDKEGYHFITKQGKRLHIKVFSKDIIPHSIKNHKRLRCSACHSQWSYQDYGLSVIREDAPAPNKWYYLSRQSDPFVEELLNEYYRSPEKVELLGKDWLTGKSSQGVWFSGWRFRRWEPMPLGLDQNGRYSIIRPRYQFLISYVDRLSNVPLSSVIPKRGDGTGPGWAFMPYVPHTISPTGAMCVRCHKNRLNLGLGIYDNPGVDTRLMIPSPPSIKSMRLLNKEEKQRLLNPSSKWKEMRLKHLMNTYKVLLERR